MHVLRFAEAASAVLFSASTGLLVVDMGHPAIEAAWNRAVRALTADGWEFDPDEASWTEDDREAYELAR